MLLRMAAARVRDYLSQEPASVGLRLGVKRTGCSGWAYVVGLAKGVDAQDQVFEHRGIKVVVDEDSLKLVDGTEIDFVRTGLNELFQFKNPNVADECGCGESFSI